MTRDAWPVSHLSHVTSHIVVAPVTEPSPVPGMTSTLSTSLLQTRVNCARRSITTAFSVPFRPIDITRPALSSGWSRRRSTGPLRLVAMASGKLRHDYTYKSEYYTFGQLACAWADSFPQCLAVTLLHLDRHINYMRGCCSASLDPDPQLQV